MNFTRGWIGQKIYNVGSLTPIFMIFTGAKVNVDWTLQDPVLILMCTESNIYKAIGG
ncbi:MAG: hypothetical protein CM15mP122_5260 [Bacteroidota bacterium]|nr:MAG: hypothetical protein CM15mP122_5260 [Bacteroidota bacterium]